MPGITVYLPSQRQGSGGLGEGGGAATPGSGGIRVPEPSLFVARCGLAPADSGAMRAPVEQAVESMPGPNSPSVSTLSGQSAGAVKVYKVMAGDAAALLSQSQPGAVSSVASSGVDFKLAPMLVKPPISSVKSAPEQPSASPRPMQSSKPTGPIPQIKGFTMQTLPDRSKRGCCRSAAEPRQRSADSLVRESAPSRATRGQSCPRSENRCGPR